MDKTHICINLKHVELLSGYLSSWGSCVCLQQIQCQREQGESDEKESLVLYDGCVVQPKVPLFICNAMRLVSTSMS